MDRWGLIRFMRSISLFVLLLPEACKAGLQNVGTIYPGFQGSQMTWINLNGLFLISNNSNFAFGFSTTKDVTQFLLVVVHTGSSKVIWSANRGSPVSNSDKFIFGGDGKVSLQKGEAVVWTADTGGKRVSAIEMQDSGNLVLLGNGGSVLWQSFSHPTDTLISNQDFVDGMKLVSDPNSNKLTHILEIKSGDMMLSAGFQTHQPYWSIQKERRVTIDKGGGKVSVASLSGNSWKFYDGNKVFLSQFIFSDSTDANGTSIAVLGNDGFISFYNLDDGGSDSQTKIPSDPCSRPEPCDAHYVCSGNNVCQCPSGLSNRLNCQTEVVSSCDGSNGSTELVSAGDRLNYFALGFVPPSSRTDLEGCKSACRGNCSCLAFFFHNSSGNCFLFSDIGSFQNSNAGSSFVAYIKVSSDGGGGSNAGGDGSGEKSFPIVVIIVIGTLIVICGLLYMAFRYHRKKKKMLESPLNTSEDDNFLETLSGMPIRFSYRDLQTATNNFSVKLGHGGFGSEDMNLRPSMTKVVQMLEGLSPVPLPPTSSPLGSRLYSSFFKSTREKDDCFSTRRSLLVCISTLPFLFGLHEFLEDLSAKALQSDTNTSMLIKEEVRKVVSKGKAAGVLRLVFHDAGTFEMDGNSGGMNGSIVYELERPENAGLKKSLKACTQFLTKQRVKWMQYNKIFSLLVSWADMIAVAGAEAVSVCGGPTIPVQLGRLDSLEPDAEGKLPRESLDAPGLKQNFKRKGLSTQELVALSGAHTLGSKGFGSPFVFDNSYYKILLEKPWKSPGGMSNMIGLPSDHALVEDDECLRWIKKYADNQNMFFNDFKNAYIKLVNSGARWKSL
ncbi:hypothetical protein NC651_017216 [Populus alba x Populus x berolinensis]|nr:hypothetical protein NC651_017216 [Populus alba x Populus x berolinensis]